MKVARIVIVLVGIVLPYAARVPGGADWTGQYLAFGPGGVLFFHALNAVAWGSVLAISYAYRRPLSVLFPALPTFAFLAWAHATLDLAADAQAAIALLIFPMLALPIAAVGGVLGFVWERYRRRRSAAPQGR